MAKYYKTHNYYWLLSIPYYLMQVASNYIGIALITLVSISGGIIIEKLKN